MRRHDFSTFLHTFASRGAAQGEGLGNAFLSNIAAVDGIFHVCRAFTDPDVTHVEDRIDPVDDLKIIFSELRAKDIERVQNFLEVCIYRNQLLIESMW